MTMTVNITDFRNNIFRYADLVQKGYEIEILREGRTPMRLVKTDIDDVRERGRRAYQIAKRLAGKFKNVDFDREFFRGKKELEYMKKIGKW